MSLSIYYFKIFSPPIRASSAVVYNCYVFLFVESKMKKRAPAVLQNSSSTSNFFTKWTVALQNWKATVHSVKIKKLISLALTPPSSPAISSDFFLSLFSFLPKISLSSSHLFSTLSSLFALSAFCWSTKLVDSVVAWACWRGGGWRQDWWWLTAWVSAWLPAWVSAWRWWSCADLGLEEWVSTWRWSSRAESGFFFSF